MSNLGSPSRALLSTEQQVSCEALRVAVEFCNPEDAAANQEIRHAQVVAAIIASGVTFENGDAITADSADFQFVNGLEFCAVAEGTLMQLDDGTQKRVTCDDAGMLVDQPENGNATAYSRGAKVNLGHGPKADGYGIQTNYLVSLLPGAGASVTAMVSRCSLSGKGTSAFVDRSAL